MYVVARGHVESFSSLRMRVLWYAQVMAISTLSLCFDNYKIFQGVVKIRKGVCAYFHRQ